MSLKKIVKTLKSHKSFLICTHVNCDIDGLSSELVLGDYLRSLGKKVMIVSPDTIPMMYQFLPGVKEIKPYKGQKLDFEVALIVDCGDLARIDCVTGALKKDTLIINIDHHITNDHFGNINYVDPKASSTAEIIYSLLKFAKGRLTKQTAMLLYMGIMTDTGSFRYDNTTSHTHAVVSELLKFGFPISRVYRQIYETVPLNDIQRFTKLISQFEMTHSGQVASLELPQEVLSRFSEEFDLREKVFSFLRAIKGIQVIAIFTKHNFHETRVNFRSQGHVDVAKLASLFGGGGHRKASGCRIAGNIALAKQKIFSVLNGFLK